MSKYRQFLRLAGLVLAVSLASPALAEQGVTTARKAALQATMQQHIQRLLVDGAYLQLDFKTGKVHKLHPVAAHPMILRMGKYFVLCADFRDDRGRPVNVDFYVAPKGRSHVVFQAVIDDRRSLHQLVKLGRAKPVN